MMRKRMAHDAPVIGYSPTKRRRTAAYSWAAEQLESLRSNSDFSSLSDLLLKWSNDEVDPMTENHSGNGSCSSKSSSSSKKGNLWTEVGRLSEESRNILTPLRRKPILETVVNFHQGKFVDCYQRLLNSDETTELVVLRTPSSYSSDEFSQSIEREYIKGLIKKDDDEVGRHIESPSEDSKDVRIITKLDNQATKESTAKQTVPASEHGDSSALPKGTSNISAFSNFETELRSRIGELLSCFKESAEKEIKSKGIFPECSLELPDERTVLLRELADNAFLELNDDQTKEVIAQWNKQDNPNEVLAKLCSIPVTRADLQTLMGYNWLNDEIVNFYMQLLVSRSKAAPVLPTVYAFSTFFFLKLQRAGHAGVCKWTKDVDIFSYDLLFIPIHLSNHWVLTVVDVKERFVKYYDSLGASGRNCLLVIGDYLAAEMKDKKGVDMDRASWRFATEHCPRQGNCSDCGMFVLKYAEFLSREAPLTFSQEHMPLFRIRVAYEILHEKLL